jgi:hypothetical protein
LFSLNTPNAPRSTAYPPQHRAFTAGPPVSPLSCIIYPELLYQAMEDLSRAMLAEMFKKRIAVLDEELGRLKKLNMPPETSVPGLLRLPIEIRLQIYYYCVPRKRIIDVANPRFNTQWYSVDRILDFKAVRDDTESENLLDQTDSEDVQDLEDNLLCDPHSRV